MNILRRHRIGNTSARKSSVQRKSNSKETGLTGTNSLWHRLATRVKDSGDQSPKSNLTNVQAKLKVGQPGDRYEVEADRVADQVMRMPEAQAPLQPEEDEEAPQVEMTSSRASRMQVKEPPNEQGELVQPMPAGTIPQIDPDLESQIQAMKGRGQPLPESTRNQLEQRFGQDFSQVQVQTDEWAAESARLNRSHRPMRIP